jgi:hypothetical protein
MWTGLWVTWGVLCVVALAAPEAKAIPVVPNFQQGTLSSTTKTTQKITEVINSYEYRTGYEVTTSGTNIAPVGGIISPTAVTGSTTNIGGVTSTWTGIDLNDKPTWQIVEPGASFQFVETVNGPGLTTHTIVERTTEIESLTETLSTFTQ